MNKTIYAKIDDKKPDFNCIRNLLKSQHFLGGQVQELVKAAIKVETMRALNPDLDSTASGTPSEDSIEQVYPGNF